MSHFLPSDDSVLSPESDDSSYSLLRLPGGLTCLLSSFPPPPPGSPPRKSAVAICVGSGSFDDPYDLQGSAHFLEHLVFMGSRNYQGEDDFMDFVKRSGGSMNAATYREYTVYHVETDSSFAEESLSRLSDMVFFPLLREESIRKEVSAVENEFQTSLPNDSFRAAWATRSVYRRGHPYRNFFHGDRRSLSRFGEAGEGEVRESLLSFHSSHYVSGNISCVVSAPFPLPTLRSWAERLLSPAPCGPRHRRGGVGSPLVGVRLPLCVDVRSDSSPTFVSLEWTLPPDPEDAVSGVGACVMAALGDEGEGSLLSDLRERGIALDLFSDVEHTQLGTQAQITLRLTPLGLSSLPSSLEKVFARLGSVRRETASLRRFWGERASCAREAFRWREREGASDFVHEAARRLMRDGVGEKFALVDEPLYDSFDEGKASLFCSSLSPSSVLVTLRRKCPVHEYGVREAWTGVPMRVLPFPSSVVEAWRRAFLSPPPLPFSPVPPPNPFLPSPLPASEGKASPLSLSSWEEEVRCWWGSSGRPSPRLWIEVQLCWGGASSSLSSSTLSLLCASWSEAAGREFAYSASSAGASFSLLPFGGGVRLSCSGFPDQSLSLARRGVDLLLTLPLPRPSSFLRLRRKAIESASAARRDAMSVLRSESSSLLSGDAWSLSDQESALGEASLEGASFAAEGVVMRSRVDVVAYGERAREAAEEVGNAMREGRRVKRGKTERREGAGASKGRRSALRWEEGGGKTVARTEGRDCSFHRARSLSINGKMQGCCLFYDVGEGSVPTRALCAALSHSLRTHLFNVLRTEKGICYYVGATPTELDDRSLLVVSILSSTLGPEELGKELRECASSLGEEVGRMEEWGKEMESLSRSVMEEPSSFWEEASLQMQGVRTFTFRPDDREEVGRAVRRIRREEVASHPFLTGEAGPFLQVEVHTGEGEDHPPLRLPMRPATFKWDSLQRRSQ